MTALSRYRAAFERCGVKLPSLYSFEADDYLWYCATCLPDEAALALCFRLAMERLDWPTLTVWGNVYWLNGCSYDTLDAAVCAALEAM